MIESRCGILCSECNYRGLDHCGACEDFPCEMLNKFAYDEGQGDNGKRIEQCKKWKA